MEKRYLVDNKELMKEWNYEKNKNIDLFSLTLGMRKKVWWKCSKCKNEWEATINNRSKGRKCPYCSNKKILSGVNDFKSKYPELINEWDYEKNIVKPDEIASGSDYKAWWKCEKGHSWQTKIYFRTRNRYGCPICAKELQTSFQEQVIYFYFSKVFKNVYNRFKIQNQEIDIFIDDIKLGIEYDGFYFHNTKLSKEKEERKERILNENNIRLLRIKEVENKQENYNANVYYLQRKFSDKEFENIIHSILERIDIVVENDFINIKRDRNLILNNYIINKKKNSLKEKNPELAKEWNYIKNGKLLPEMFSANSHKKVWWKCSKCGNEWEAIIANRNDKNRNCPYCSNQKVIGNENSVEITHPEILKYWDFENNDVNPSNISYGADKKINFKCEKGHQFSCLLYSFVKSMKCPVCQNRKVLEGFNDLQTTHPNLCKEWNYEKNGDLSPTNYTYGSGKKVWWKCKKCGNEWETSILNRSRGTQCPKCRNK